MKTTLFETSPASDYAGVFDRLERALEEQAPRVAGEMASAPELLAELLALPERMRRRVAISQCRYHLYSLAAHALERATEEARLDLCSAYELVRLARLIASRVSPRLCGEAVLEELRDRSLLAEANLVLACGGIAPAPRSEPALELAYT
ncbi:MAG TPA: hypothetical protein VMM92_07445 [Thermoanaerobaculia bacterium]|nr:hypothetical protein [Thermoanaerobaculia bacterium]